MKLIRSALSINIYDLNYLFSNEKLGYLNNSTKNELPKKGILLKIIIFNYRLLENINHLKIDYSAIKKKVLFFVWTKNQKDAVFSVKKGINNSVMIGLKNFGEYKIPLGMAYIFAIPFFPLVVLKYLKSTGYRRKSFLYNFDKYWLTYGFYLVIRKLLLKSKPSLVIVSNDHTMYTRVFTKVATEANIKTIYIPHASVTINFPKLSYNYALLDGYDSLYKYAKAGKSNTIVFLVGNPKFDQSLKHQNKKHVIENIGISISTLDKIEDVSDLCTQLVANYSYINFILRPHPKDDRISDIIRLKEKYKMDYSDSREENPINFLKRIDLIISSSSNIHLEAAMMNIIPIYYEFTSKFLADYYGFIQNGLIKYYYQDGNLLIKELENIVKDKPETRNLAKRYNYTINTSYDGLSAKLSAKLLNEIKNNNIDYTIWEVDEKIKNIICYCLSV